VSASPKTVQTDGGPRGRRRRGKEPEPRETIQKVKLSHAERERLRTRAAELGVSVPRLLVESALDGLSWTPTELSGASR
jgi:hypothetical protein